MLPMAAGSAIVFSAFLLKDGNGSCPALPQDFSRNLRALHERLPNDRTGNTVNQAYVVQFDYAADVTGKFFNLNRGSGLDSVLFSTCLNDCVHAHISLSGAALIPRIFI